MICVDTLHLKIIIKLYFNFFIRHKILELKMCFMTLIFNFTLWVLLQFFSFPSKTYRKHALNVASLQTYDGNHPSWLFHRVTRDQKSRISSTMVEREINVLAEMSNRIKLGTAGWNILYWIIKRWQEGKNTV